MEIGPKFNEEYGPMGTSLLSFSCVVDAVSLKICMENIWNRARVVVITHVVFAKDTLGTELSPANAGRRISSLTSIQGIVHTLMQHRACETVAQRLNIFSQIKS